MKRMRDDECGLQATVSPAVIKELKRIVEDSEIMQVRYHSHDESFDYSYFKKMDIVNFH